MKIKMVTTTLILSFFILGCSNSKVILVGEVEETFNSRVKTTEYQKIKLYPESINNYSKEL